MARIDLRNQANAPGNWFVDTRCIDCGTCREIAPGLFGEESGLSVVSRQPRGGEELDAWLAAQACPTISIGTTSSRRPRPGQLYPREVQHGSGVFDLGYCSENSFGASAWLVVRPAGNVLVDSPRFSEALARRVAELGGVRHVAFTHRDDVADGRRWAERFRARSWIHADDRSAATWATELLTEEQELQPRFLAIPVPGHTKGSVVFLLDGRWLFTGDSLAWSHERDDLTAFRGACWYSWAAQSDSLARLAARYRFSAVLPGHGARHLGDADDLHDRLVRLVERMRA